MAGYSEEVGRDKGGLPVYSEKEKGPSKTYELGPGAEERLTIEGTVDHLIGKAQPITTPLAPGGKVR